MKRKRKTPQVHTCAFSGRKPRKGEIIQRKSSGALYLIRAVEVSANDVHRYRLAPAHVRGYTAAARSSGAHDKWRLWSAISREFQPFEFAIGLPPRRVQRLHEVVDMRRDQ